MIQLAGITKRYPVGGGLTVLDAINLDIARNDCLGILGPSGSGKSSLLNILGLLDRPTSGRMLVNGVDMSGVSDDERSRIRGRTIGFVFQSFHLVPQLTVQENVELPLFYQQAGRRERQKRAARVIEDVGLADRATHRPSQLSGGECQRTAIARALVTDPELILADEPTGNLDTATGGVIMDLLHGLHAAGRTLVLITHDPSIAQSFRRIVRLRDGRLEDTGCGDGGRA